MYKLVAVTLSSITNGDAGGTTEVGSWCNAHCSGCRFRFPLQCLLPSRRISSLPTASPHPSRLSFQASRPLTQLFSNIRLETKAETAPAQPETSGGKKSTAPARTSRGPVAKPTEAQVSREVTSIPRLHKLAKQRLARFYTVQLMYQQLPSNQPPSFFSAEIVVLSTDLRALFWSLTVPNSPKNRFMMPSMQQAILDYFQPTYGSMAAAAARELKYDAVAALPEANHGRLVILKKASEVLVLLFDDVQLAFHWFQMLILGLGLYYMSPGTSLLSNLTDRKSNFVTGLRDRIGESTQGNIIVNVSEKDSTLQNYLHYYKVFSVASLKDGQLLEREFVIPYKYEVRLRQVIEEWEKLLMMEFNDVDFCGRAIVKDFFRSVEYNLKIQSSFANFPLFSDTTSNLQRAEAPNRAFICRKKLIQVAKKIDEKVIPKDCEAAKVACSLPASPYEEFLLLSDAFFKATVMRCFLIAQSVRVT